MLKKDKLNILILAFRTPPEIRPRAIAIGKIMPEFIKQGLKPVVITYENGGQWKIDAPVYKIPQFNPGGLLFRAKLSGILHFFYYQKICAIAEKLIKRHDIKAIFSFSSPQESNIIGAMIKRKTGIPFISHFSDPWYDDPYKNLSGLSARKVLYLERFIIKNSDKAIFINKAEQDLVMEKYPKTWIKKAAVVRHCYNPDDYTEAQKNANGKFVFSHIGAFYKQRNPEIFFKAVGKAIKNDNEFRDKILIKLVGGVAKYSGYTLNHLETLIDRYGLNDLIEILPPVEYRESLRYMKLSNCLVAIDADNADSICSPSKLFDYAGSGVPIIGVTPENSPTQEFLSNLGYQSFTYNQIEQLADYIRKLVNGEIILNLNKKFLERFNVKNIAAEYNNVFCEAAKN